MDHGSPVDRAARGRHGEALAADFLRRQGLEIWVRNYRWSRAEIDIVAFRQNRLHFVEVKARAWRDVDLARAAVDRRKQAFIMGAAGRYMEDAGWEGEFQFDVVVVIFDGRGGQEITWVPDAFGFPGG